MDSEARRMGVRVVGRTRRNVRDAVIMRRNDGALRGVPAREGRGVFLQSHCADRTARLQKKPRRGRLPPTKKRKHGLEIAEQFFCKEDLAMKVLLAIF